MYVATDGDGDEPSCSTSSGTITLSPGLTDTAAAQSVKIHGTLTGCAGETFTEAKYTATLTTPNPVSCSVLQAPGEPASGPARYTWLPKAKSSTGALSLALGEGSSMTLSGSLGHGSYSPATLSGAISESYVGAATCSATHKGKPAKPITKATFKGSTVYVE